MSKMDLSILDTTVYILSYWSDFLSDISNMYQYGTSGITQLITATSKQLQSSVRISIRQNFKHPKLCFSEFDLLHDQSNTLLGLIFETLVLAPDQLLDSRISSIVMVFLFSLLTPLKRDLSRAFWI